MPISSLELKNFLDYSIFVETGSASGDGIQSALNSGFSEIYSVEIDFRVYKECQDRFKDNARVHLSYGDCGKWLTSTLNAINKSCVLYMDANGWKGETESPFYSAIEAILRHGKTHHLLMIDDMNHGFKPREEVVKDLLRSRDSGSATDVIRQLMRINPDYTFYIIDTHNESQTYTYPSWVLVCDPIKNRMLNLNQSYI